MAFHENPIDGFTEIANRVKSKGGIKTIIEIGARDCGETLIFNRHFPQAKIFTFECNPATLPLCRERTKNFSNISLIEKAVSIANGQVTFHQIDSEKTETTWKDGNPGASSLLQASGDYPVEKYVQNAITVTATRLDDFFSEQKIDHVDLLWMDIQGSELNALKSLGDNIQKIDLIHTEVEFFRIYKDQPLFENIYAFMRENNFTLIGFTSFGPFAGDAVFINKNVAHNKVLKNRSLYAYHKALRALDNLAKRIKAFMAK